MIDIDRDRLHSDLAYRIAFARQFIGFTDDDAATLNSAAALVGPLVKGVVDSVYSHLFEFSYTKQPFLPANTCFTGSRPAELAQLTLDDAQIVYRKKFLTTWALKVFTADYSLPSTWEYLDKVGLMHTGQSAGFKHRETKPALFVDLLACSLLLGWVETVLISAVLPIEEEVLPLEAKTKVLGAVNKILWIQQDLFQRHYVRTDAEFAAYHAVKKEGGRTALSSSKPTAAAFSSLSLSTIACSPVAFPLGVVLGALLVHALLM